MDKYIECTICRQHMSFYLQWIDLNYTLSGERFMIYKCTYCWIEKVHPMLSSEELKKFYPSNYYSYQSGKPQKDLMTRIREKTFLSVVNKKRNLWSWLFRKRVLNYPQTLKKEGRYLDIWCGSGPHFPIIESTWWQCSGFEFWDPKWSTDKIAHARHIDEIDRKWNKFDMVTMRAVLEHLSDPHGYMSKIYEISTADMKLTLSVPNTKSWYANWFKKFRYNRDIPRHLYNYNPKNITLLLEQHGFVVNRIHYIAAWWFILSIATWLRYISHNRISFLFHIIFVIIFLPLDWIANLCKRWDLIIIEASKK